MSWIDQENPRDYSTPTPISSSSAPTVNDDSGDGYAVGQVWIETTNKVPYMLADAAVGSAVWRPILSDIRLKMYVTSGVVYSVLEGRSGANWITIKGPVVITKTAGSAALGTSASGTGFFLPTGYATAADQPSEGDVWLEKLDGTGGLGVTWTPGSDSRATIDVDSDQTAGNSYAVCGYVGRSPGTAPGFRIGWKRNNIGTAMVTGEINDLAEANANASRSGACTATLYWCGTTSRAVYGGGRQTSSFTTVAMSGPSTSMTGTPMHFGIVLTRVATGGGDITTANASVIFTPAAGSLTWT